MRELLFSINKNDFEIESFRAGGKGGQHQNKTDSAIRIRHPESGAVAESRSERSQHQNKIIAFRRLLKTKEWKLWFKLKCSNTVISKDYEKELKEKIEKMLDSHNIKTEIKVDGKWIEIETDFGDDDESIKIKYIQTLGIPNIGKMDIKKALCESGGDIAVAISILKTKNPIIKLT